MSRGHGFNPAQARRSLSCTAWRPPGLPELPEIEHLRRTLEPILVGATIRRVRLLRRDIAVVVGHSDEPVRGRHLLAGMTIAEIRRHGKHLAIIADCGRALCVHLGMTGQLRILPAHQRTSPHNHVHCIWRLEAGGTMHRLIFRDPRRFGGLAAIDSTECLVMSYWANLGKDALTITADQLAMQLGRSRRCIKAALLDQGVLAGVGNIYADEALFRAGIHPASIAASLSRSQVARLTSAIHTTLSEAIRAGGSTIRDYVDASGDAGSFASRHRVYGRAAQPCVKCTKPLASASIAQRTSVFCEHCQTHTAQHSQTPKQPTNPVIHNLPTPTSSRP